MKRLLILADRLNAAYHHRAGALERHAPPDWSVSVAYHDRQELDHLPYGRYDVVLALPTPLAPRLRALFSASDARTVLVASHNSGPERRREMLRDCLLTADYTIVNNFAAYATARRELGARNLCNISNGVDLSFWRNMVPWDERPDRVLWIATRAKVDEPFEYGDGWKTDVKGWHDLARHLDTPSAPWEADIRIVEDDKEITPEAMRDWYNAGRYFVVTSHSEGTPNTLLEAASCGCAVLTTPVGNAWELIEPGRNGQIFPPAYRWLIRSLRAAHETNQGRDWAARMRPLLTGWDWQQRAKWFFWLFDQLAAGRTPGPFSYLDRPERK